MDDKQNRQNLSTGQQGTNEPWKKGDEKNGRPNTPPNVVEQELRKKQPPGDHGH